MRKTEVYAPGPLPHGLRTNVAMFLLGSSFMLVLIDWLRWSGPATTSTMLPPKHTLAAIWLGLFLAMAVARWLLVHCPEPYKAVWADILGLACLSLPLYSAGFRYATVAYFGTIATALLAALGALVVMRLSKTAAALLTLVLFSLAYAAVAQRAELYRLR